MTDDAQTLPPTSPVGSYAQPNWLIDREKLAGRFGQFFGGAPFLTESN